MVNFLQIDELVSRRWPTQQKEEKIQQEYSSFSEKIHNNLQRSLEETLIQEMKKETEGQVAIYQRSAKLTVQLQEEAAPSFSKKMNSIPLTSEELTKSEIHKISFNQQSVLKKVLKENGDNTAESINASKVLQEDVEIPSADSGVMESKQEPLLFKEKGFVEKEALKEGVASAVEVANASKVLREDVEIPSADSGVTESEQEFLPFKQQKSFLKSESVEKTENGEADSINSLQLLQEEKDYTLSQKSNAASLIDNAPKEDRKEQNQSSLQFPLEKLRVKKAKEEGMDSLKLTRLVQEGFAPEISSLFQNPAKLVRLFQDGKENSLSQKTNSASLISNESMEINGEQTQPSFRYSLEKKYTEKLQGEGGELAELIRGIKEEKGAALLQTKGDVSLVDIGWTGDKQGQIPSKQQSFGQKSVKESEGEVEQSTNPTKVFQEVTGYPFVIGETVENAGEQILLKQQGLDKTPMKEPEVEVTEPVSSARVSQGAKSFVLSQEVKEEPFGIGEMEGNGQPLSRQLALDKGLVKEPEVAEPVKPTKVSQGARNFVLSQEVTENPFVTGEVIENASGQIPSEQQGLNKEPVKESEVEAEEPVKPAKVSQEAKSFVLSQEVTGDPFVTSRVVGNGDGQPLPQQQGLDKEPVKEPEVEAEELVSPARVLQGARNFVLPQEVTGDPFAFANGKVVEGKENSSLLNQQNSLEKRFAEIGKGKVIEPENPTFQFTSENAATSQRQTNGDVLSESETKEAIEVLLTLSNQALALQQLQGNAAFLSELSQIIGQFLSDYGNIQLQELPPEETQKLVTCLETVNAGQLTMSANTSIGQMLSQWTTDVSDAQVHTEQVNLFPYSNDLFVDEGMKQIDSATIEDNKEQETVSPSFTESLSVALDDPTLKETRVQGQESVKHENVLFSNLDKKLKQKVEEIQKFVVKNERIFLQLNPEKFGTVEVYLKKQQDSIQVHVQTSKEESQKQLDIIFEDIKAKLKEQDIQIEITYTERERQERQEQRGEQREQVYAKQQHQEQEKQQENPFKQLWEGIEND